MADPIPVYCLLVSKILDKKICMDGATGLCHESDISELGEKPLLNPGFICYFLNYLRECSASVLKRSDNVTALGAERTSEQSANSNLIHINEPQRQSCQVQPREPKGHMMSTPKLRDDIITPKSGHGISCPSIHEERFSSKNQCNSFHSTPPSATKQNAGGKSAGRVKNKTLSLSDFLSPEAGSSQASGRKKHKQKSQKMKKGTPSSQKSGCTERWHRNSQSSTTDFSPFKQNSSSFRHSKLSAHDAKSPANPLYSEASRNLSFDLEEEFPSLNVASPQVLPTRPTRRIKPTAVITQRSTPSHSPVVIETKNKNLPETGLNPFVSASPISATGKVDLQMERDLLRLKRSESKGPVDNGITGFKTPVKTLEDISPVKKVIAEPSPSHVVAADKTLRLSEVYSYYISSFLVPSIINELQFVVDLLSVSCSVEEIAGSGIHLNITGSLCNSSESCTEDSACRDIEDRKILSTVANAVHFAVHTIHALVLSGVISILTHSSLSILAQNHRIGSFLPSLPEKLSKLADALQEKDSDSAAEKYGSQEKLNSFSGVPFEADKDDRSNFASDKSFHAFRKHRDSFYSLFREYEEKRLHRNFSVRQNLASRIKALVSQVIAVGTNRPFTRLFVSQMLIGMNREHLTVHCSNQSLIESSFGENHQSRHDLVASLQRGDPEKFRRLQSRFVTASTSCGGCATDPISEQCHFYEEFVLCADSYTFNTHLCNELRSRIAEIESQQSQQILDDVTAESVNTFNISSNLSHIISTVRILGRFLGFLTFHPYRLEDCATPFYEPGVFKCISSSLDRSIANGHQLLTIPWVTEYLKSANFVATLASEQRLVVEKLFYMYKKHSFEHDGFLTTGDIMISLAISTLFEMSIFPEDQFYQLLKSQSFSPKNVCFSRDGRDIHFKVGADSNPTLDEACSALVSLTLIYDWHQPLKDIRALLMTCNSDVVGKSSRTQQPPRKIKPSTEIKLVESNVQNSERKLQSLLEDHFFRGQPSSLKRTVSFVAERCASNCVKHIRSVSMLEVCAEAEEMYLQRRNPMSSADFGNNAKSVLSREVLKEVQMAVTERMHCVAKSFCERTVPLCMQNLSSCETADGVLDVAVKIAKKRALASVHSWLAGRLNELVTVSVKARLTKVSSAELNAKVDLEIPVQQSSNLSSYSPMKNVDSLSSLLHLMKECIVKLTFPEKSDRNRSAFCCDHVLDPALRMTVCKQDISSILHFVAILLSENKMPPALEDISESTVRSMQELVDASSHLKNCLVFTAKELSARSDRVFG